MGGVFHAYNSSTGEVKMGGHGGWEVHWPASLTYLVIPRPMRDNVSKTKQQPEDFPTHPPLKTNRQSIKKKKQWQPIIGHDVTIAFTREFTAALVPAQGPHRTKPTCSVGFPAGIYWTQPSNKTKATTNKTKKSKNKIKHTCTKKTWSRETDMMGCTCRKWTWRAGGGSTKYSIHMPWIVKQ